MVADLTSIPELAEPVIVPCWSALSIIGGGDSNAALKKSGEEKNVSYMSSGGGAFLELLEGKTLPGVAVLDRE